MFDNYCGSILRVKTRSSPLLNIDFCLAINTLRKQNVGKIFLCIFFFKILKRTYSSAFKPPLKPVWEKSPIVAVLKPPLKAILEKYKNAYSGGLKLLV